MAQVFGFCSSVALVVGWSEKMSFYPYGSVEHRLRTFGGMIG